MKFVSIKAAEMVAAQEGLTHASIADVKAFIPAGQLLARIAQASNGLKKDILAHTLRIVAGQPCGDVLPVLTDLRAKMKEARAAGDSSVGMVRAAVAALAARHGPSHPVPTWSTAAEARAAQKVAEAAASDGDGAEDGQPQASAEDVAARQAAELEELRAIAAEARRFLRLQDAVPLADVLAQLRAIEIAPEDAELPRATMEGAEVTEA